MLWRVATDCATALTHLVAWRQTKGNSAQVTCARYSVPCAVADGHRSTQHLMELSLGRPLPRTVLNSDTTDARLLEQSVLKFIEHQ